MSHDPKRFGTSTCAACTWAWAVCAWVMQSRGAWIPHSAVQNGQLLVNENPSLAPPNIFDHNKHNGMWPKRNLVCCLLCLDCSQVPSRGVVPSLATLAGAFGGHSGPDVYVHSCRYCNSFLNDPWWSEDVLMPSSSMLAETHSKTLLAAQPSRSHDVHVVHLE